MATLLLAFAPPPASGQALVVQPHAAGSVVKFVHPSGAYWLEHPADWTVHEGTGRITIGTDDGLVAVERGFRTVYGAIVAIADDSAPSTPARTIETSAGAMVDAILKRNPHQSLSVPVRDRPFAGAPAASAVLIGRSPVTGRGERAEIVVRAFGGSQVLYAILVSPTDAYPLLEVPLRRLRDSVRMTDAR